MKRRASSATSIAHLRLRTQRIAGSMFGDPVEAVRFMLAMQAQDFPGAKWSLGLRCAAGSEAAVSSALAAGQIVRSWPMRGTLHFTAAEDLHWMLGLTTARLIAGAARRRAALQLDERTLERARAIAQGSLAEGRALTREQMLAELDRAGVSTEGQRGYHILWFLSQTRTLCFGPPRGAEQTFVLLDEWVKRPRRLERDEALGEFARRYFTSHGPATVRDFAGWTKLTAGDVKIALAVARDELAEVEVDGTSYWMGRDTRDLTAEERRSLAESVVLLPGFDEYMLGYSDRAAVLRDEHRERIVPGGNGIFMNTIVVGGQIAGTWRRQSRAKETLLDVLPFSPLGAAISRGVARAAAAYGRYLGVPVRMAPAAAPGVARKRVSRSSTSPEGAR